MFSAYAEDLSFPSTVALCAPCGRKSISKWLLLSVLQRPRAPEKESGSGGLTWCSHVSQLHLRGKHWPLNPALQAGYASASTSHGRFSVGEDLWVTLRWFILIRSCTSFFANVEFTLEVMGTLKMCFFLYTATCNICKNQTVNLSNSVGCNPLKKLLCALYVHLGLRPHKVHIDKESTW